MMPSRSTEYYHGHQRYASEDVHTPPWELTAKSGISDATRTPSSAADREAFADDKNCASNPRHQYTTRSPTSPSEGHNTTYSVSDASRHASTNPPASAFSPAQSDSSGTSSSSFNPQRIQAFPGTMSARHGDHDHTHVRRSQGPDAVEELVEDPDCRDAGKLNRMKSAVRNFFKKRHVDERQFETIGNRHWADDSD